MAISTFDCSGAPRDLGLDQGTVCRETLATRFARTPFPERFAHHLTRSFLSHGAGLLDENEADVARELRRHFPAQSEWLEGAARGAGVPTSWLAALVAREFASDAARPSASIAVGTDGADAAGALLAKSMPGDAVVRRAQPEGLFRSVEVTRPWLPCALLGVNEAGIAAAYAPLPGPRTNGRAAAPAALLIQDCLQRFGSLDACLDWCRGRPATGHAALLFADASGDVATVEVAGEERHILRPAGGLVALPGRDARPDDLAKQLRDSAPHGPDSLRAALASREAGSPLGVRAIADPKARRVGVVTSDAESLEWVGLET